MLHRFSPSERKCQESADLDGGGAALQCPANIDIPIPMKALCAALEEHGDQVSQPCPSKPITRQARKAGVSSATSMATPVSASLTQPRHTSNNVLLFLLPNPGKSMQLKYQCLSERCMHEPRKLSCWDVISSTSGVSGNSLNISLCNRFQVKSKLKSWRQV